MRRCRTRQPTFLIRCARFSVTTGAALIVSATAIGQTKNYALDSPDGLRLHSVTAEPMVLQGKKGLRITISDEAQRRLNALPAQDQGRFPQFAIVEGIRFGDGVIEAEIAGAPRPDAGDAARGFVGINFRVQGDLNRRDTFYLRPTNGRADDQERRNRAVQYISHPDWTWLRLCKELPAKYESYGDLVPGAWTKIRIDVRGERARLYVHDRAQPTLIVNDLKSGPLAKGAVALWIDLGTVAHFRNLTVQPLSGTTEMK